MLHPLYPRDPKGRVLAHLRAHTAGLAIGQLNRQCFGGHLPAKILRDLLNDLLDAGLIRGQTASPNGRAVRLFFAAVPSLS